MRRTATLVLGPLPLALAVGLLVVLVVALLAGCDGSDGADGGSAGAAERPVPGRAVSTTSAGPRAEPTRYPQYVALGDSYTSAPLVPPADLSSTCFRSQVNYPALVAAAMPGTTLTDVSCGGATTVNARRPQVPNGGGGPVPPQLHAVRRTTDLVTIGLGGNDDSLFATTIGCTQYADRDPDGSPCADAAAQGGRRLDDVLVGIRHHLDQVVADVRRRAPDARVLLVGYPQIIPAEGSCDLLPLATGDYAFAREINRGLTEAVRLAARDSHAGYVDIWSASAGHDICAPDPWVNGRITSVDRALAYHPLAVEQRAVADLVVEQLRR